MRAHLPTPFSKRCNPWHLYRCWFCTDTVWTLQVPALKNCTLWAVLTVPACQAQALQGGWHFNSQQPISQALVHICSANTSQGRSRSGRTTEMNNRWGYSGQGMFLTKNFQKYLFYEQWLISFNLLWKNNEILLHWVNVSDSSAVINV